MRTSIESLCGLPDKDCWTSQYFPPPSVHGTRARAIASAMLAAQAPVTARAMIKESARAYALKPRQLDAIAEGLFSLQPCDLVRSLRLLTGIMRVTPQRLLECGGKVLVLNLKGAMLYARWSRRVGRRTDMRAAS